MSRVQTCAVLALFATPSMAAIGCYTGDGETYMGTQTVTVSGKTCQAWELDSPHDHSFNYLPYNYCRNPDGEPGPWCYTTDPDTRWELCEIPECEGDEADSNPGCSATGVELTVHDWHEDNCRNDETFPAPEGEDQTGPGSHRPNVYARDANVLPGCGCTEVDGGFSVSDSFCDFSGAVPYFRFKYYTRESDCTGPAVWHHKIADGRCVFDFWAQQYKSSNYFCVQGPSTTNNDVSTAAGDYFVEKRFAEDSDCSGTPDSTIRYPNDGTCQLVPAHKRIWYYHYSSDVEMWQGCRNTGGQSWCCKSHGTIDQCEEALSRFDTALDEENQQMDVDNWPDTAWCWVQDEHRCFRSTFDQWVAFTARSIFQYVEVGKEEVTGPFPQVPVGGIVAAVIIILLLGGIGGYAYLVKKGKATVPAWLQKVLDKVKKYKKPVPGMATAQGSAASGASKV